jgi:hypothetical protein
MDEQSESFLRPGKPDELKFYDLVWLLLVGDVHQPSDCATQGQQSGPAGARW